MPTQPAIIVSSLDYERLAAWMERLPAQDKTTLAALEAELERAEVVEPENIPAGIITMNSTARVRICSCDDANIIRRANSRYKMAPTFQPTITRVTVNGTSASGKSRATPTPTKLLLIRRGRASTKRTGKGLD